LVYEKAVLFIGTAFFIGFQRFLSDLFFVAYVMTASVTAELYFLVTLI
jgi:hypothetical protein